jgi:Protein of unknown function (DUF4087)
LNTKFLRTGLIILAGLLFIVPFTEQRSYIAQASTSEPLETRCGWFSNPTPANASLYDREREWTIAVQGGYQAKGDWPEFGSKQWIETNVHYGYGCACLKVRVDREKNEVIEIVSSRARPLATCRRDRSLRRWEFK